MKSILDKSFVYVNSAETDIAKTFKRIRKEQAEAKRVEDRRKFNVTPINTNTGKVNK